MNFLKCRKLFLGCEYDEQAVTFTAFTADITI